MRDRKEQLQIFFRVLRDDESNRTRDIQYLKALK